MDQNRDNNIVVKSIEGQKERIKWIDISKAIAIIFVIIGHTAPFGSIERNMIFSFHMPLFFILSGYNFTLPDSLMKVKERIIKNIRQLLFPLINLWILNLIFIFIKSHNFSFSVVRTNIVALLWSSGIPFKNHPGLGMLWFLVSMFIAYLLINLFALIFKGPHLFYLYYGISFFGIYLGITQKWLPLNFDVTLVCTFFLVVGMMWKQYESIVKKYYWVFFFIASIFWSYCICNKWYIELATRSYPGIWICVAEAIFATFLISQFSKSLESNKYVSSFLSFIGKHTLIIYGVHSLDWFFVSIWSQEHWKVASAKRLLYVLIISLVVYYSKKIILQYSKK
jgi:fucose 4-O-acetylase-like acetyltransferase